MPRLHTDLLLRQHLLDKLAQRATEILTLITAPAGFGKTTLVHSWVRHLDYPVAWLSIDERDNDPKRYWTYLVAAIQAILPDIGDSALQELLSPVGNQDVGLTLLLNDLADLEIGCLLVLDDYHLIDNPQIDAGMQFLVDNLPPQLHLLISSRSEPDLPLARLRARRQLLEITAQDLRFTRAEMQQFFSDLRQLTLTDAQLDALENRTEGWIAGLQMAALSMQQQDNLDDFITAFTGNHHHILDYLVEEVLDQQAPEIQDFLLETSILDAFTADLCEAITAQDNAQTILLDLSQRNLFISALDDDRRWFRYHQLFVEFLRNRLQSRFPERVAELHAKAAQWFNSNDMIPEAIELWLAGEHYEQAANMIEAHGAQIFWRYHEWYRLHQWLDQLPRDLVYGRPILCAAYGWATLLTGQPDEMLFYLDLAEESLSEDENPDTIGEVVALRAEYAMITGKFETALELAAKALTYLSDENIIIRSLGLQIQGYIYRNMGNMERAAYFLREAHRTSLRGGNLLIGVFALTDLGNVYALQGKLNKAISVYERILRENDKTAANIGLGSIYRERNHLEKAIDLLHQGIELAQQLNISAVVRAGNIQLAYALYAHGDIAEAMQACDFAVTSAHRSGVERIIAQAQAHQMTLQIYQNDLHLAEDWVEARQLRVDQAITYDRELELVVFARLLIARKQYTDAIGLLERIIENARADGRFGNVIEDLVLLSLAHYRNGDSETALKPLSEAVERGFIGYYVRAFVDVGSDIAKLLRLLITDSTDNHHNRYISRILDAFEETPPETVRLDGELIEDLSEREMDVLKLLSVGMSNREIAEQLIIGNSTVKTHTLNIYRKLNVNNRTHAVTRARSLQLI